MRNQSDVLFAPQPDLKLLDAAQESNTIYNELRSHARADLYFLTKAILGFRDLSPDLHMPICKEVQNLIENKYLLLLLPRKHFKSTIATIGLPIWLIIQEYVPSLGIKGCDIRILIANESATNAEHFLNIIETIFDENELFRSLFPELLTDKGKRRRWNAQEMLIKREATWPEATIETIGVGGAAQSRHYDVRLLDDLIGKAAMDSETVMEDAISWFDYAESLSVSPQRSVCRVLGTRWSKRDLYQHIISDIPQYKVYTRQCIENNEPIFPEWYTVEYYDNLRKTNFAHYSSQYLNNPTDPEKCDFRGAWLKYYTWIHDDASGKSFVKLEDREKAIDFRSFEVCGAFDPSVDEKSSSSKRAIVYAGMDSDQDVVILDVYASRDSVDRVLDAIFEMHSKWSKHNLRRFGVESVALSRIYITLIIKEGKRRRYNIRPEPIKVSTHKSKDARIRDTIQQVAAQGHLYIASWMRDFIEEFMDFPQGRTKDVLDAATHAINLLRVPDSLEEIAEDERADQARIEQRSVITGY